ncbi:MAG TPA: cell envelope integrity protein TolA [Hyphomicrobiaceae bacterium]|nr:cell envelope integrity protein TolA [Hyphomicrobiaceae bacterium]
MYFGLLVSVVLHATLLGWTIVSIQGTPELKAPEVEPIAVEMISPSDLTRLTRGSRRATLKEARAKDSPEVEATPKESTRPRPPVAQPPPPPPPPAPEPPAPEPPAQQKPAEAPPPPPPAPAPTPEPDRAALEQKLADLALQQAEEAKRQAQAKAEAEAKARAEAEAKARAEAEAKAKAKAEAEAKAKAEAEAKRKAEEKRRADLKRKQEEKRREAARLKKIAEEKAKAKFDADRLAALLDKSPDPRSAAPAAPQPSTDTKAKGPVLGAREGQDSTLSASQRGWLAKLLGDAVGRCWNVMAGVSGVERLVIKVQVRLNRDGTIIGAPKVTNSDGSPLFALAADSTVRAMIECAPYNLPQDMYTDGWEYIEFAFRPPQ